MSVWDYIRSLQHMDFETFQNLVDVNCDVTYVFNGKIEHCTGSDFVQRLKKGHFENTIKCDIHKLVVEKIATPKHFSQEALVYSIGDDTIYHRLGFGKDENGPGEYDMHSEGVITFLNGKIVRMIYSFIKVKLSNPDVDLSAFGGANAVKNSANNLE